MSWELAGWGAGVFVQNWHQRYIIPPKRQHPVVTREFRVGPWLVQPSLNAITQNGTTVHLQPKVMEVLVCLAQQAGQTIPKEELIKRVWAGAFVTDDVLKRCVSELRRAFQDDVREPRIIETIPKRGYRMVGPVVFPASEVLTAPAVGPAHGTAGGRRLQRKWLAATLVAALGVGGSVVWLRMPLPVPRVAAIRMLTHDGLGKFRILTDGSRLYIREWDGTGNFVLAQGSVSGGETSLMRTMFTNIELHDISPDRSQLLVGSFKGTESEAPLWTLPLPSGAPRRVGDLVAHGGAWSPDGRTLVFAKDSDLFLASSEGLEVHKLATVRGVPVAPRFSPDGGRVRFSVSVPAQNASAIWEVATDGKNLRPLFPDAHGTPAECCGSWSYDGRYYFYISGKDVWALPDKLPFLGGRETHPIRLTSGPLSFSNLVASPGGGKLFAVGEQFRGELVRHDPDSREYTRYLSGISAGELDFSRDGQWVTYVSYPERILWRSRTDGSERIQLSSAPVTAMLPRWSPDGSQILYSAYLEGRPWRLLLVPAKGGIPEELLPGSNYSQVDATWSIDGTRIAFGQFNAAGPVMVLDLKTRQVSQLLAPERVFSPRWSPDGRHIAVLSEDSKKLLVLDVAAGKWWDWVSEEGSIGFLTWSLDSKYLYFDETAVEHPAFRRVRVGQARSEVLLRINDLSEYSDALIGAWTGVAPDGSALFVRDLSTREVYSLDLEIQ